MRVWHLFAICGLLVGCGADGPTTPTPTPPPPPPAQPAGPQAMWSVYGVVSVWLADASPKLAGVDVLVDGTLMDSYRGGLLSGWGALIHDSHVESGVMSITFKITEQSVPEAVYEVGGSLVATSHVNPGDQRRIELKDQMVVLRAGGMVTVQARVPPF